MTEQQRAKQALAALAAIDRALATLEDVQYEREGGVDTDEGLWEAIDRFLTAYAENCDRTTYTYTGTPVPGPKDAIERAAKARL